MQAGTLRYISSYTQTSGSTLLDGGGLSTSTTLNIQGGALGGEGTITGNVTTSDGGAVAPGLSSGTLFIIGNYTQTPTGVIDIEVAGLIEGAEFDRLNISNFAAVDGTLNVTLINGFEPDLGDSMQILTFSSRTGEFANITGLDIGSGKRFEASYNSDSVTLFVVPAP